MELMLTGKLPRNLEGITKLSGNNIREYPVAAERSGKTTDFANYVSFLQNLKNAFQSSGHNYGLSITVCVSSQTGKHPA